MLHEIRWKRGSCITPASDVQSKKLLIAIMALMVVDRNGRNRINGVNERSGTICGSLAVLGATMRKKQRANCRCCHR